MGFEAEIWVLRLEFGSLGWNLVLEAKGGGYTEERGGEEGEISAYVKARVIGPFVTNLWSGGQA